MKLFETAFFNQLSETNMAGAGGVFGDAPSMGHGGATTPTTDFYAPGDMRTPMGGKKNARAGVKSKKKKKKPKNGQLDMLIPMQKRPFNTKM